MTVSNHTWAIVLAAGEGSRLRESAARNTGRSVPTQFCSLRSGGSTLVDDAMQRARMVVSPERVCTVVAEQHRHWWRPMMDCLPAGNVIVQPANRGTAISILYSVLQVMARDPEAQVLLIPADHFVAEEAKLERAMQAAVRNVEQRPQSPVLVGLEPQRADTELGYIVPGPGDDVGGYAVKEFVEKPGRKVAMRLLGQGALWNTFIIAASGRALLDSFFAADFAQVMAQMRRFMSNATEAGCATRAAWSDMVSIYQRFPVADFSRDILARRHELLRVVKGEACGWNDLGTPLRVAETLRRLAADDALPPEAAARMTATADPSGQHEHFASQRA